MNHKHVPMLVVLGVVTVVAVVLFTNLFLLAGEHASNTITIVATVRPLRMIIVDRYLTVQSIVSNTRADIRPLVVLDTQDGKELPYTDAIREQYESLKPILNFSVPGIVYQRDARPIPAFLKAAGGVVGKWTTGSL